MVEDTGFIIACVIQLYLLGRVGGHRRAVGLNISRCGNPGHAYIRHPSVVTPARQESEEPDGGQEQEGQQGTPAAHRLPVPAVRAVVIEDRHVILALPPVHRGVVQPPDDLVAGPPPPDGPEHLLPGQMRVQPIRRYQILIPGEQRENGIPRFPPVLLRHTDPPRQAVRLGEPFRPPRVHPAEGDRRPEARVVRGQLVQPPSPHPEDGAVADAHDAHPAELPVDAQQGGRASHPVQSGVLPLGGQDLPLGAGDGPEHGFTHLCRLDSPGQPGANGLCAELRRDGPAPAGGHAVKDAQYVGPAGGEEDIAVFVPLARRPVAGAHE